jgi:hypothetical protein
VVANHLGILVSDHTDPGCVGVENSKQCVDATQFRTCIGGLDRGLSDCGYYGLACETEELFAYCVDPRCVNGGQNSFCLDGTRIAICEDGVYREGDCAGFGLPCVEGFGTAWCWADFYQASSSASSLGAPEGGELSLHPGQAAEIWFDLENTGLATWTPGTTKIAPLPRDEACPLEGADWLSPTRAATVVEQVAPGEVGRFAFSLTAASAGDHDLGFGLVQEGVTWFADPPGGGGPADGVLAVAVHVSDAPDASTGEDGGAVGGVAADSGSAEGCGCASPGRTPRSWPSTLLLAALAGARRRKPT